MSTGQRAEGRGPLSHDCHRDGRSQGWVEGQDLGCLPSLSPDALWMSVATLAIPLSFKGIFKRVGEGTGISSPRWEWRLSASVCYKQRAKTFRRQSRYRSRCFKSLVI